jgi:hypothetical protein
MPKIQGDFSGASCKSLVHSGRRADTPPVKSSHGDSDYQWTQQPTA